MPEVIRSNRAFRNVYHRLGRGDIVVGQLNLKPCEEYIFLDLVARGVDVIPHPLSQQLSRSKCMQAQVYESFMLPGTSVIRCRSDLVKRMQDYAEKGVERVITKQDRGDCGQGINLWPSVEDVYNAVTINTSLFPFVLQPFQDGVVDVRVIIIEGYIESYWRKNPVSFRNNIHFGGESGEYQLDDQQMDMCLKIMSRGRFPFAHIDLLVAGNGDTWLGEISLRGGIKGAAIAPAQYLKKINEVYDRFIDSRIGDVTS
jgi:ribosomal protein S6--L-glutamate ligase